MSTFQGFMVKVIDCMTGIIELSKSLVFKNFINLSISQQEDKVGILTNWIQIEIFHTERFRFLQSFVGVLKNHWLFQYYVQGQSKFKINLITAYHLLIGFIQPNHLTSYYLIIEIVLNQINFIGKNIVQNFRWCWKIEWRLSKNWAFIILTEVNALEVYITNNVDVFIHMIYLTIGIAILFALINYILSFFLFFLKSSYNKTAYECGFEPFDEAMRHPFDVHFYVVGLLFLIFDLEISCLLPAALNIGYNQLNVNLIALFLIIITLGFILEYNLGVLDWFFIKFKSQFRNITYLSLHWSLHEPVQPPSTDSYWNDIMTSNIWFIAYFIIIFVYILIYIVEISGRHHSKNSAMGSQSALDFYSKFEYRIKFILSVVFLNTLFFYLFSLDRTYYYFNQFLVLNINNLYFQLLLSFLLLLSLKIGQKIFFNQTEHFFLFPIFFLSNFFFLSLLILANHLIIVLIAIIGINIGLYILLFTYNQKTRLESGLKYFFLSLFVIIILYMGIMLIYSITHYLDLVNISIILPYMTMYDQRMLGFIYFLLMFIFFFKCGIFPANFFLPEIYRGLSPFLFTYIALPLKATFFAFIIQLFEILIVSSNYSWFVYILYIVIIFSFLIGAFGAISSTDIYNFFAYISITQLGWLLFGLISHQNMDAILLYYFYYFLMSSILVYMFTRNIDGEIIDHSLANFITHKQGIARDILLIATFLTLSGLPPAAAFIPKLYILISGFAEGFWWLAFVAIISSIVSGYYYTRIAYLLIIKLRDNKVVNLLKIYSTFNNSTIYWYLFFIIFYVYFICLIYWPYIFV